MREGYSRGRVLDDQAEEGGDEDAEQDAAADLEYQEHCGDEDADDGQEAGSMADVTESHEGGVGVDDQAGILQADEGDEQADTGAYGALETQRNGVEYPLPYLRKR